MHLRDPSPEELAQEVRLYRFRNQLMIGRNAVKRIAKEGKSLGMTFSADEGGPLACELRHPDEQTMAEFMVVMSNLLRRESDLYFRKIVALLRTAGKVERLEPVLVRLEQAVEKVERGKLNLTVNDAPLTAREAYLRIVNTILEADDTKALDVETNLARNPPLKTMLWFLGYEYCLDMHKALYWMHATLAKDKLYPEEAPRDELCIYCLTTEGAFNTREHTLPESLGNSHSILPRGWVCAGCQSAFSSVEGEVLKMAPFAATRILATRYTKQGKFPSGRFRKVHLRKTRPNRLHIMNHGGKHQPPSVNPDGTASFRLTELGGRFDHVKMARMLIKAALGAIALERGRETVLSSRYNKARRFARYGESFAGRLLLKKHTERPHGGMSIEWQDGLPGAIINIHGVEMLISLMPHERPPLPPEVEQHAVVFELDRPADYAKPGGGTGGRRSGNNMGKRREENSPATDVRSAR